MKLKLLGTGKKPLSLKLGDNIKVDLGSRIFKPLNVTENGTYVGGQEDGMLVGFTPVNVNVASVEPKIEPLEVTENGVYNSNELDGYKPVTVNVKSTIEPLTVTENGTYNSEEIDGYKPVVVDVPVPSDTTAQVGDILEGKTAYIEGLKQIGILKAKKFTTGTYTPALSNTVNTITHNLGTIPTVFLVYPTDYEAYMQNYPNKSEQAKGQLVFFTGTYYSFVGGATFTTIGVKQGNINTGQYQPQGVDATAVPERNLITDTTANVLGTNPNYYLSVGVEYTWIAIE